MRQMPASLGTQSILPEVMSQYEPILDGIWVCPEVDLLKPLQKRAVHSPSGAQTVWKDRQVLSIDKTIDNSNGL